MKKKVYTNLLASKIEEITGYYVVTSFSKTDFGESHYILVKKNIEENFQVKIRLSDHSVSSFDRLTNEIHLGFIQQTTEKDLKRIVNYLVMEIRWKLETSKYFLSKETLEIKKSYNVQTEIVKDSDIITKEFMTKKGKNMYFVTRTYKIPSINWIYKETNNIFFTESKKMKLGGVINEIKYSIGGL